MKTSSLTLRRVVVWALVIALLATMGLAAAAGTAMAAPTYTLTAKGCGTTTTATLADGRTQPLTKTGTAWMRALGMQSPWIVSIAGK